MLSRLLDEYRTAREERFASTSRRAQAAAGLLVVGLQQRLLSSIEAFARSLKVHRATVERQWGKGLPAEIGTDRQSVKDAELFTLLPTLTTSVASGRLRNSMPRRRLRSRMSLLAAEAESPRDAVAEMLWLREQALLDQMQAIAEKSPLSARRQSDSAGRLDPGEPVP